MSYRLDTYHHANGPGLARSGSFTFPDTDAMLAVLDRQAEIWRAAGYRDAWVAIGIVAVVDQAGTLRAVTVTRDAELHDHAPAHDVIAAVTASDPQAACAALRERTRRR